MSSAHTSGFWHERSTAPKYLTRSRTPTPSANDPHTLRLNGRISPAIRVFVASKPMAGEAPSPSGFTRTHTSQQETQYANLGVAVGRPRALPRALPLGTTGLGPSRRSVCAQLVLEGGVRLRVDSWRRHYVRAKNLKWATTTLRYSRFETRFFASFLFAFEKK